MQNKVSIVEVGPRDGLQNIKQFVATKHKIEFIKKLTEAGCRRIEVTSFVRKDRVPQMSDAEAVCAALPVDTDMRYSALVANKEGFDRALAAGIKEIAIVAAASETFSRKNIGKSIDNSFVEYGKVAAIALQNNVLVRGYVSTAFHCPYEGKIAPEKVADVTARLFDLGVYEVSLADTIGQAGPRDVTELLTVVIAKHDATTLALHMHDTGGRALSNVLRGFIHGIRTFDSSVGGLGGCPFANVSVGNVATEDLADFLEVRNIHTGIDLPSLVSASRYMEALLQCELPSRYLRSLK